MKKVRTVFAAVMALCICFAMAGCGKSGSSDEITIDNIDEKFENMSDDEIEQAIVEGLEELDEGNGKSSETAETENAAPAEIVPSEEIIAEKIFSDKVQIGSKVYTFPLTVAELLENGELRLDDANADGLVKPGDSEYIKIKGTDIKLGLSAVNNTNEMTELKNCIVSGDGISANMSSKNVFYSGGLKVGMPYTEFIELYGEPDYIDNEDYYRYYEEVYSKSGTMASVPIFSATGYECWVKINMDEACVGAFNIYFGNHNKDYEENFVKLGDNGYYWNAPGDFAFDNTMLIEADGNKYLLDASHKFRARSTQKEYFPDALTEEALTNWYTSKDAELKCCKVNDDGTAYVIRLKNNDYYEGYYHSEDNLAEIRFWLYNTDKDNNEEIPQAAKDEAYKLLEEIFSKGITFETAAE